MTKRLLELRVQLQLCYRVGYYLQTVRVELIINFIHRKTSIATVKKTKS